MNNSSRGLFDELGYFRLAFLNLFLELHTVSSLFLPFQYRIEGLTYHYFIPATASKTLESLTP